MTASGTDSGAPHTARKFYSDDPLLREPAPRPVRQVEPRKLDGVYDFLENMYVTPRKEGKEAKHDPHPASNINTLGDVDARADIYGLGCVAYYLLTGTLVFNTSTALSMAIAHIQHPPELPSRRAEVPIPASLERVVMNCLEKKREDRPQSSVELDALLEACADIPEWTQADAKRWWALHRPRAAHGVTG